MVLRKISDGPAGYLPTDDIPRRQELIQLIHQRCEAHAGGETPRKVMRQAVFWSLLHTLDIAVLGDLLKERQEDTDDEDEDSEDDVSVDEGSVDEGSVDDSILFGLAYGCGRLVRTFVELPIEKKKKDAPSDLEVAKACLRDDHKCIVTGWSTADVGHIFPYHARTRLGSVINAIDRMHHVWGWQRFDDLSWKLNEPEDIVDTVSNMLCMDSRTHWLWSQGYFALEPLDDDIGYERAATSPASSASDTQEEEEEEARRRKRRKTATKVYGIRLRFHWLPRTTIKSPDGPADFTADPRRMWTPLDHQEIYLLDTDGQRVESGRIIDIHSEDESALPDRDILQLRWDALRMYALSGGADPSVYMSAFWNPAYDSEVRAARKADEEPTPEIKRAALAPSLQRMIENRTRREHGFPELPPIYDEASDHDASDDGTGDDGTGNGSVSDVNSGRRTRPASHIQDEPEPNAKGIYDAPTPEPPHDLTTTCPDQSQTERVEEIGPENVSPGLLQTLRRRSLAFLLGQRFE